MLTFDKNDIKALLALGLGSTEIGRRLGIGRHVVDYHVVKIMGRGPRYFCVDCGAVRPLGSEKYCFSCAVKKRGSRWDAAKRKEWVIKNRSKLNAYARTYNKKHPEVKKRIVRKWARNNQHHLNSVAAQRRTCETKSTPNWANGFYIEETYRFARLKSKVLGSEWHVDHIVPLKSKIVCGLHVHNNLRVIPALENIKKRNRFWPDMP